MHTFTRGERLAVLLLTALIIAGGGVAWWRTQAARRVAEVAATAVDVGSAAAARAGGGSVAGDGGRDVPLVRPAAAELIAVHVAGAVRRPGLYRLPAGSRVDDAVAAAGGPAPGAALDSVNLAAVLRDGQKVTVGRLRAASGGGGAAPGGGAPAAPPDEPPWPIDVNSASAAELERLPGVGPVIAGRIVEYREANGPFKGVDDLLAVRGIGPRTLEQLRPYVTVD